MNFALKVMPRFWGWVATAPRPINRIEGLSLSPKRRPHPLAIALFTFHHHLSTLIKECLLGSKGSTGSTGSNEKVHGLQFFRTQRWIDGIAKKNLPQKCYGIDGIDVITPPKKCYGIDGIDVIKSKKKCYGIDGIDVLAPKKKRYGDRWDRRDRTQKKNVKSVRGIDGIAGKKSVNQGSRFLERNETLLLSNKSIYHQ